MVDVKWDSNLWSLIFIKCISIEEKLQKKLTRQTGKHISTVRVIKFKKRDREDN